MNEYYTEAGPNLAKKMNESWEPIDSLKNITSTFSFEFITETLVQKLVSEIKISKSSAIDNLSSRILKDAFSVLTVELTHLYNTCIETCIKNRKGLVFRGDHSCFSNICLGIPCIRL